MKKDKSRRKLLKHVAKVADGLREKLPHMKFQVFTSADEALRTLFPEGDTAEKARGE